MTAPITNYNVSSGKDLNTIFSPLYLNTNNNDLIIVTQQGTPITPVTDNPYKYFFLDTINTNYMITLNSDITPQDELTMILVGGGASGRNGFGGRASGGGAGGGGGVFKFNNKNVSMGTQFTASIGATTAINSTTTAGSTSVNFFLTNTYLVQATGGGPGQQSTDNTTRAVSGNCLTNLDYAYFGTLVPIFADSSGGIGPQRDENDGSPYNSNLGNFYNPYYSRYYWGLPRTNNQSVRHHADNITVLSYSSTGQLEWSHVMAKSQYDDQSDDLLSFQVMNTGGQLHVLFNQLEKRFNLLNDFTMKLERTAVMTAINMNPSPLKVNPRLSPEPRFTIRTPRSPKMMPFILLLFNLSLL